MKEFKPTAMPCTEEQWLNEIKPLCDKYGVRYEQITNFEAYPYLVSSRYTRSDNIVTNFRGYNHKLNRTLIEYSPAEFMRSMGIEIEEKKWQDKTRGGYEYHIYEEFEGKIFGRIKISNVWYLMCWDENGKDVDNMNTYDLIPYNPIKSKLQAEIEQKEKELKELKNKLNQI